MPTDPVSFVELAALVLIAAVLYSAAGQAGGSGYLAAMALFGVAPSAMKPTAFLLGIIVAVIGTVRFAKAGHTPWPLLVPLCLGSIPAAFVGGTIALPTGVYEPLLAVLLMLAALRLWFPGEGTRDRARPSRPGFIAVGAVLGLASGLTGMGGGVLLAPVLILTGWENPRRAVAASSPFILVNSIAGLLGLVSTAQRVPQEATLLVVVALAGGLFGSWLGTERLHPRALQRVLALIMVVAATKLVDG